MPSLNVALRGNPRS